MTTENTFRRVRNGLTEFSDREGFMKAKFSFIQKILVLYVIIWTISPPLQIDMIYRVAALGAIGLWFILNLPLLIVMTIIIVIVIVIVKKIIKKIFGNDILNSKGNNRVSEDDDSNKSDDNLPDSEEVNDSNDNGDEFVEVHEEYENHEDEQK